MVNFHKINHKEWRPYDVCLNSVNLPFEDILTNLIQGHLIKYLFEIIYETTSLIENH